MAQTIDGSKTNIEIVVEEEAFSQIKAGDIITYQHAEGFEPTLKGDTFIGAQMMIVSLIMGIAFFIFLGIYVAKNEQKLRKLRDQFFE